MSFDWTDYLQLAKELATNPDEANKRSAISRAYYCIFNLAKDLAENQLGYQHSSYQNSHKPMWDKFEGRGKTLKAIHSKGLSLKRRREQADYYKDFSELETSLGFAIAEAEAALQYLSQARSDSK